jgi:hypothetical protein
VARVAREHGWIPDSVTTNRRRRAKSESAAIADQVAVALRRTGVGDHRRPALEDRCMTNRHDDDLISYITTGLKMMVAGVESALEGRLGPGGVGRPYAGTGDGACCNCGCSCGSSVRAVAVTDNEPLQIVRSERDFSWSLQLLFPLCSQPRFSAGHSSCKRSNSG